MVEDRIVYMVVNSTWMAVGREYSRENLMTLFSDYARSVASAAGITASKQTVTLSAAQLIAGTQVQLVAAPAAGYYVHLLRVEASLSIGVTPFTAGDLRLGYPTFYFLTLRDFLDSPTAVYDVTPNVEFSPQGATKLEVSATGVSPPMGDSTVKLTVHYEILPLVV